MNILIIDDSSTSILLIAKLLKKIIKNTEVIQTNCGKNGLSALSSGIHFDLIILDLGLPDIGGLEVLRLCREQYSETPIITISDESSQELLKQSLEMGAIDYLTKPLSLEQFQFIVEKNIKNLNKHHHKSKILIVDDAKINRLLLKKILDKLNFDTFQAVNGAEAVEMVATQKFDCILMDINMPVMDGFEATKLIRKRDSSTPIIAVTTEHYNTIHNKCIKLGFNLIHEKPVNIKKLSQSISDLIHFKCEDNFLTS